MRNCALEEYMVTERHDDVLLLYRNTPSVILGRNQTVAAEIDGDFCRAHGIEVVRRLSGGGAVYHDLGNINYAFVSNKEASPVLDRDFLRPVVTLCRSWASKQQRANGRNCWPEAVRFRVLPRTSHATASFSTAHCYTGTTCTCSNRPCAATARREAKAWPRYPVPSPTSPNCCIAMKRRKPSWNGSARCCCNITD